LEEFDFGEESISLGDLDNYSADATLHQLLYSGGRVGAALKAAVLTEDLAGWSRAETESLLARDIRIGFFDILLAGAAVSVRQESVRQLRELLDQTRDKFESGAASEFDVLAAEVSLSNEEPHLIAASNALEIAKAGFRRLLNLGDEPFRIAGELDHDPRVFELETLLEVADTNRAAIRAQSTVVELREQDVSAAHSGALPELNANFTYRGTKPPAFAAFENDWDWRWSAGLTAEWDVWDGGLTRGQVKQKKEELGKSRTDLDELRRSVALEVRQHYLTMVHAQRAVDSSRGNVELAKRALGIAETRYQAGLATRLEYADANLGLSTARLTWYQAIHAHKVAVARLRHACGLSDQDWQRGDRR
jgi:outer membrane protein TolC